MQELWSYEDPAPRLRRLRILSWQESITNQGKSDKSGQSIAFEVLSFND
jgi:hypothetical protein